MQTEVGEQEGKIIWQADFFSDEYLPKDLIGRKEQVGRLQMCLSPMKDGQAPLNTWLYGPAGTGKTAVARVVARAVCESSSSCFAFYTNCWERRSLYSVVQAIAESLKILGADAQDTNVKLDRIRQVVKGRPMVVVLDDIDRIAPSERQRIIHTLFGLPHTGVMCISNRKETLLSLEEGTRSRLSPIVTSFPRYRPKELEGVLFDRARHGLAPNTWNEAVLGQLARSAGGDARTAMQGLRQAAVSAESASRGKLTLGTLPNTFPDSAKTKREEVVSRLSYHEQLIYDLARQNAPVTTTDLRPIYEDRCQKNGITPVARRTFSKYLKMLGDSGLLVVDQRTIPAKGRLVRARSAGHGPPAGAKLSTGSRVNGR